MKTVALDEVADVLYGFAFDSERFGDKGDLPLVRIRDVVRGRSNTYFTGEFETKYIVDDGDLLIGMDGEFNRQRWAGGKALLNQRVCRIRATDPRLDESYLYWFLPEALKEIERHTPFVTVKHLSAKQIKAIKIPLPPIEEQRRIASILDAADALRAKRRQALERLRALTQSVFIEMFGDPKSDRRGHPMVRLGDLMPANKSSVDPRKSPETEFDLLSIPAFDAGRLEVVRGAKVGSSKQVLLPGDVLLSKIVPHIRRACVVPPSSSRPIIGSSEWLLFRSERFNPAYLREALISDGFHAAFMQTVAGVGGSLLRARPAHVAEIEIALPALSDQERFAEAEKRIRLAVDVSRKSEHHFNALFASLQHRAFRGEL